MKVDVYDGMILPWEFANPPHKINVHSGCIIAAFVLSMVGPTLTHPSNNWVCPQGVQNGSFLTLFPSRIVHVAGMWMGRILPWACKVIPHNQHLWWMCHSYISLCMTQHRQVHRPHQTNGYVGNDQKKLQLCILTVSISQNVMIDAANMVLPAPMPLTLPKLGWSNTAWPSFSPSLRCSCGL
jgi:hypothetical protein